MSINYYQTFLGYEETMNNEDQYGYQHGSEFTNTCLSDINVLNDQYGLPFDHNNSEPIEIPQIPDTCFNYITNLLHEQQAGSTDDLFGITLEDYMSFNHSTDVIGEISSLSSSLVANHVSNFNCFDDYMNMFSNQSVASLDNSHVGDGVRLESHHKVPCLVVPPPVITDGDVTHCQFQQNLDSNSIQYCENNNLIGDQPGMSSVFQGWDRNMYPNNVQFELHFQQSAVVPADNNTDELRNRSNVRKHGEGSGGENRESTDERRGKQSATSNEVFEEIDQYGDVLLCPEGRNKPAGLCSTLNKNNTAENADDQKLQKKRGKKQQVVDLKSFLSRCAQCVARVDLTGAYDLIKQIRQNSSPYGDYLQRVSHYLVNGLEARLEGKGFEITRANEQVPPCEVLKANRVYVASVPFKIMSYYTTNKTIAKLVEEAPSIHIIDFGIFYGLQWPCIIQNLSKRPNGPPKIRITGIDFPQRGFRPAERVEETGRCLAKYCERYNVHFEYHAIAKKWEDIDLEELKIERNEPLVVNCLYRSHYLFDESIEEHSPRDAFLNLVRKINPDIFMHGIVNSQLCVPFFLNRFKEAMFHYTALFDLFEATMKREDKERMLLESKLYGNQALNVIACEDTERIERAETYKQWQVRTQRAGFVQVPLDRELLKRARAMVRRNFREEFSYDEDDYWVVQGWKGRILYAISCWKPQEV